MKIFDKRLANALELLEKDVAVNRRAVVTVENLMMFVSAIDDVMSFYSYCGIDPRSVFAAFKVFVDRFVPVYDEEKAAEAGGPAPSKPFNNMMKVATASAYASEHIQICGFDVIRAVLTIDCSAGRIMSMAGVTVDKLDEFIKKSSETERCALAVCMNDLVMKKQYHDVVGRDSEIEAMFRTLNRYRKQNVLLVGEPGVGKTAIVEGFVRRIVEGRCPSKFVGCSVYSVDIASIVAGTKYRGEFESKMKALMEFVSGKENTMLFIDELHTAVGAGSGSSESLDAGNIMKPYLSNGSVRVIGATTYDDYRKHLQSDKAFMRRFQLIEVPEPSASDTVKILKGILPSYESHHGVSFTEKALEETVRLCGLHFQNLKFPDKAIDVVDAMGSDANLSGSATVDESSVREYFASKYGFVQQADGVELMASVKDKVKAAVFGQDEQVNSMCDSVAMAKLGFKNEGKPLASILMCGQTGTGKTEFARQLAAALGSRLLKFDMSEYQSKEDVSKLIGAAPGYVGFDQGGRLVEEVFKNPSAVVLLDEIEKAHPDIYNVLLQVMDDGVLTDNSGKVASFRGCVILMTSNVGAEKVSERKPRLGFAGDGNDTDSEVYASAVRKTFRPEFINRLDLVVYFNPIGESVMKDIVRKFVAALNARLSKRSITVRLEDDAVCMIASMASEEKMGGRPVERIVDRLVSRRLMEKMVADRISGGFDAIFRKEGDKSLSLEICPAEA